MTEHNQANADNDTPSIPSLILHESRERHDRQDAQLHSLHQLCRGALIILFSAGAIAVAASQTLAALNIRLVLLVAMGLLLATAFVEVAAVCWWHNGPKISDLVEQFHSPGDPERTTVDLQLALIDGANADHKHNQRVLTWVKIAAALQAIATVFALGLLVAGFGTL